MKAIILTLVAAFGLFTATASFADYPAGTLSIFNASNNIIHAKINGGSGFKLIAQQNKEVNYHLVSMACSSSPESCTAQFFINDQPVGSATIDTTTGKLISMHINHKVKAKTDSSKVLRQVIIF